MRKICIIVMGIAGLSLHAQTNSYINERGEKHLCGPVRLADLIADTLYSGWYNESYGAFVLDDEKVKWKKNLKDVSVDIYFGSWCGDSKNYVPKFVHAWNDLGLDESQLNFIALYDGKEKYKQGPKGEEKGLNIHRVPTFIFKRDSQEFARMVEYPRTSIERDLAQIALGYPSAPSYPAASYMQNLLEEKTEEEIYADFRKYLLDVYHLVGKRSELNTLGYVYLRSDRLKEALICFDFNTHYYRYNPSVYNSFAEGLLMAGDTAASVTNYEKVLELKPDDENAIAQLKMLGVYNN